MLTRQDISIRRQAGACAFRVTIDIKYNKFMNVFSSHFEPLDSMDYIHLDIGLLIVAYLFRRGCFGARLIGSILFGSDEHVQTESAFDNEPLFLNIRGREITTESLTGEVATQWLTTELVRAGMDRK